MSDETPTPPSPRLAPDGYDSWPAYWQAQHQPWRTEPEVDEERQVYLGERRATTPNVCQGIYPFKDITLSRADVEWLLATHESGSMVGPVDWSDAPQRVREGLDLRAADLRTLDLHALPLAKLRAGLNDDDLDELTGGNLASLFANVLAEQQTSRMQRQPIDHKLHRAVQQLDGHLAQLLASGASHLDGTTLSAAHLEGSTLCGAHLQGADLSGARLHGAELILAHLEGATLREALLTGDHLEEGRSADLSLAHLQDADLSGAHLEHAYLRGADLNGANIEIAHFQGAELIGVHLEGANLDGMQLQGAHLVGAHLEGANLNGVQLEGASLVGAHLEGANLIGAHLEGADLTEAHLERANLIGAHLEGANLFGARVEGADLTEAHLERANLTFASFSADTDLDRTVLGKASSGLAGLRARLCRRNESAVLGDVRWHGVGSVDLTRIQWDVVQRLGDERAASWRSRASKHEAVVRAYRQLAAQLRVQGMTETADRFAYRAQVCRRAVLLRRLRLLNYLGSWLLDLIAGYGYKPVRSVLAYVVVNGLFATVYALLASFQLTSEQFRSWDAPLLLSVTSFHGRVFFAGTLPLTDWAARVGVVEAIIGLLIEIMFIATFTQRFFAR